MRKLSSDQFAQLVTSHELWVESVAKPSRKDAGSRLSLIGVSLSDLTLKGRNLQSITISESKINNSQFIECDLSGALLFDSRFNGCSFINSLLDNTELNGSEFIETDFSGTCFRKAEMIDTKLANADLTGCDLSGTRLFGTDLRNAILDKVDFDMAMFADTKLYTTKITRIPSFKPWSATNVDISEHADGSVMINSIEELLQYFMEVGNPS